MKRILLIISASLLIYSMSFGQVFAKFETGLDDFQLNNWGGTGITSVTHVTDPTAKSAGVMQLAMNFTKRTNGSAAVATALSVPAGSQFITYWVYLPANTPDSVQIGVYAQDNKNWVWNESITYCKDIPKGAWYPLSCPIGAINIKNPSFDIVTGKLATGLQLANWGITTTADTVWSGNILVDNVSWEGVQPNFVAKFETGLDDFQMNNWGGTGMTSVTHATDPTSKSAGVMQLAMNFTKHTNGSAAVATALSVPAGSQFITYWVYLPANTPDSVQIGVYAQDNKNWVWNELVTYCKDIPKGAWYPLSCPIGAINIKNPNFDIVAGKLATGLQIANWAITTTADTIWSGNILVDNVSFLSEATGVKWVLVDFESAAGGVMGFVIPGFGAAGTSLARQKPAANGYMALTIDPTKGSPVGQWAIQKSDISILDTLDKSATADSLIDAIGIDILVPADYSGSTVGIVFQPVDYWTWISKDIPVKDSAGCVAPGKWSTIKWSISEFKSQIVDAKKKGSFFLQSSATGTVPYEIDFDNLTLFGIAQPAGTNISPTLVVTTDTSLCPGTHKVVDFVKFAWVDNTMGSEKYSIYMSKVGPINSLTATDVVKICPDIGHGLQSYGYRPFTTNGDTVTLYFAITSTDNGVESALTSACKKGPIKVKSTPTMKIQYVADFASKFVLDGLDDEFVPYKAKQIIPENGKDRDFAKWTPTSLDCNFRTTMIIDDKYLYISADVDDDDINTVSTYQTWQGDGLEFYVGFYDLRKMNAWHGKNFTQANGDCRIGWNTLGQMTADGSSIKAWPGVTYSLYQKLFGTSGYIIEARITLDSLAPQASGYKYGAVTNGLLFPLRIDANDIDPVVDGDVARSLMLSTMGDSQFGTKTDEDGPWQRPHTWGIAEVIGAPTGVATNPVVNPYVYKLCDNYPNPFNPSTTVQYELKVTGNTTLKVFNLLGQEVAVLVNESQQAGPHSVTFNANRLSSGVYFYTIESGSFKQAKKMMLLK